MATIKHVNDSNTKHLSDAKDKDKQVSGELKTKVSAAPVTAAVTAAPVSGAPVSGAPVSDATQADKSKTTPQQEFKDLDYTDVQINLRFISELGQKEYVRIVDGRLMQVDNRFSITRYLSNDSRDTTLNFIKHLIKRTKFYCNKIVKDIETGVEVQSNFEKLLSNQSLLQSALTGLDRLSNTYASDKLIHASIETYKADIRVFCDHDLKRAITTFSKKVGAS